MNHSFTSENLFNHILLHLLDSNMLKTYESTQTILSYPSFPILNNMNYWSRYFSSLLIPTTRYKTQKIIDESRVQLYAACSFYYTLHSLLVVRYLGGNYTGDYREIDSIVATVRKNDCSKNILDSITRILKTRRSNVFNSESSGENYLKYKTMEITRV